MWQPNVSLHFNKMNPIFSNNDSILQLQLDQDIADDSKVSTTKNSSLNTLTEFDIRDMEPSMGKAREICQIESTWDSRDSINETEHDILIDSWGHYEFLEKLTPHASEPASNSESRQETTSRDDEEKDDLLLIFQMEM